MVTINNPAMLSYKLGEMKLGIFKKVPFLVAYWKEVNNFPVDFINLIQLTCNRMDFAATEMRPKNRNKAFVYLSVYKDNTEPTDYLASANSQVITEDNFIGYLAIRAKDLSAFSKNSKLLVGDQSMFDLSSIYRIPKNIYDGSKQISLSRDAGEFWVPYEMFKTNIISLLVNYQDMFE